MIHPIPHQYCYVDTAFTHKQSRGFIPAVWIALHSVPGRLFGATVLFENGALYRDIPLHALAHRGEPIQSEWHPQHAQTWDAYSDQVQIVRLPYLDGLRCTTVAHHSTFQGHYVLSIQPLQDEYSRAPEQDKTFTLLALENGRYTCQPTNKLLIHDPSFTTHGGEWPTGLKRSTRIYSCERQAKGSL